MNKLDFIDTLNDRYDTLVFHEDTLKQRLEMLRLDEVVGETSMEVEAEQIWNEIHQVIEEKFWLKQMLCGSNGFRTEQDFEDYETELLSEENDEQAD